ncbi:MAG: acyl-CoA dehydrogenase [Bacteroidota bacterium]
MKQHEFSGLEFSYTDSMKMVQQLARDFAQKEIKPVVMKYDESQEFPFEIVKKLGEVGFMGIIFPEAYGGAGFGYLEYVVILEELSKVDPSIGLTVAAHNSLCTNHIYLYGNEKQKRKYLPALCSGESIGAWGLTEPWAGSDAASLKSTAVRSGDVYVLNGTKAFCTHGSVGTIAVVMAITDKSKGKKGISAFILEKGMEGFYPSKKENKLGMRACDTSSLVFDNVLVPAENLLGEEGTGFVQALTVLDGGRISIAALALGIAQGALETSLKYAKERLQFGKPIGEFQAIQWKLATIATEIEAARLLTLKAAFLKDNGKDVIMESSMAKYYASEVAARATTEAVQIHGGYGFIKDFPVEKYYRDVKLTTIGEGTSEIQKLVIARELLKMF